MTDKLQQAREADGIPADLVADKAISDIAMKEFGFDPHPKCTHQNCEIHITTDGLQDALLRTYHSGRVRQWHQDQSGKPELNCP